MFGTVMSTLLAFAVFWAATVCGIPTPPPVEDSQFLSRYLSHLFGHSDTGLSEFLQQHGLRAPVQAPGANAVHPAQANALLHRGFRMPSLSFDQPRRLTSLWADSGTRHGAMMTDSTLVSIVPQQAQLVHNVLQEAQLVHGPSTSQHLPMLEGIPIGVYAGPHSHIGTNPTLAEPIVDHRPDHQVGPSEAVPTFEASPTQSSDELPLEMVAGPSKPRVRISESDRLKIFKRGHYKTVVQPDPAVDAYVATLRSSLTELELDRARVFQETKPVELSEGLLSDPDSLTVNTFWNKASAKGLIMLDHSGPRHLFVTFHSKPTFLSHLHGLGFVGVWEPGAETEQSSSLFLHGFYPFSLEQYRALWTRAEPKGNYWITVRHSRTQVSATLLLTIARMSDEDVQAVAERMKQRNSLIHRALVQDRVVLAKALPAGAPIYNTYIYQADSSIVTLLERLRRFAGLPPDAFTPIDLTKEEQEFFEYRIPNAFRSTRQVKVLQLPNEEPLMFCYHVTQPWLREGARPGVTVWRFGPVSIPDGYNGLRTMYAVGDFELSSRSWQKLTPNRELGLRDSHFQYNMVTLP
ncbi:uncharacterized protein SPSC_03535 [Sporisorium scitamineum]|uniref:Effector family protein Eff1 n=1 Tax=Sporisorium scitamineum TaxID=49012 RepID=A0A0F7S8T2_9BASI|nr:uncharacterized protein SPSC_03535 [Sporisorium scitamineum]CDW97779.1 hypothetical protein [Sporisorium scitamineum]